MSIIGIDIGTTSICGIAIDESNGEVIKSIEKNSNAFIDTDREWEKIQSVEKIITLAQNILSELLSDDTKAIGVTGQMHGILYYDADGNAISPLYTWQDGRGNLEYKNTTYAKYLNSFSGYGNVTDFYNRENNRVSDGAVGYCTICDYLVMKLCGLKKTLMHSSNAASLGCFDIEKNRFDYDCDIDVTADYAIAGEYKGIPVSVAIGDNQASVFSTLADEDDILLNVGTGSQVSVISDIPVVAENIETRPYFDGKYLIAGSALCGGRAYSMLKDFYAEILGYVENVDSGRVYDIMNKMLEKSDKTSLTVKTRFAGTRSNSGLCGSIEGITTENFKPSDLTLGVLEGMVLELFEMFTLMGVKRNGIVGSGNGIRKNQALIRAFEKKFDAKMKIPKHVEEAAFGAALFAIISCGEMQNKMKKSELIKYSDR